jgi:agmatinase
MTWKDFDPQGVGLENSGVFGLPFSPEEAQVVLIPAPWGVTVSYGGGTEKGPKAVLEASPQIDYYHESHGKDSWKIGISMLPLSDWKDAYAQGLSLREKAEQRIAKLAQGENPAAPTEINNACAAFHDRVQKTAEELLAQNKLVGLLGGDHSTPLGLMRALAKKEGDFGILQFDAHCDLRDSYEGFEYSHASIMWNALKTPQIKKLVQVGIRDYSIGEKETIDASSGRVQTFFDADLKTREYEGETWAKITESIVATLPSKVYISFDIDGLDPALCPNTGTPVPGGLQFQQAMYLIRAVAVSGKKIIGFDINEVSPGEDGDWNENVGMRVLWNLALWAAKSQNLKPLA